VKRWYDAVRAESEITAAEYLRRLNALVRFTKMQPREMVEKCRAEGDGRAFVVGLAKELGRRGMSGGYVYNHAKALGSWLEYNHIPTPLSAVRVRLGRLSRQLPRRFPGPLPTKAEVLRLVESCSSPSAKLALGLAAFSGLRPGQVRELAFSNLVEFSTAGKQFSQVPSRIDMINAVTGRKYYSFLSADGCELLLDDLSTRGHVASTETVVTKQGLTEADRVLRVAKVKWFELRRFFASSWELAALQLPNRPLPHDAISFTLGHAVNGDFPIDRSFFDPKVIGLLRQGYTQIEKECFK